MLVTITGKRNEEVLTTTSKQVAETFEKNHRDVLRAIDALKEDVRNFTQMFTETEIPDTYQRPQRAYQMTRDGFSLLAMGFTGKEALAWKLKYIEAFNEMEAELKRLALERQQWEIERAKGVVIRHILTDTIKMKVQDSPHKRFAYPNYTKLVYKVLFGKTLAEMQEFLGVKSKETVRDYLTAEQLKELEHLEMLISSLIGCGWGYEQIKDFVCANYTKQLTA